MRYFTPERLAHLQDHSDERQFLSALDDWESALEAYWQQLKEIQQMLRAIQPPLPKNLQEFLIFLTTVSLHDARVLDMYFGGRSRFRITLHPELPAGRLVILTYSLLDPPPQIENNVLPELLRSEPTAWMYDELTLESGTNRGRRIFCHDILLSDGSEVRLRFSNVTLERPVPLVPAVSTVPGSP
jgi:hypothetical protein